MWSSRPVFAKSICDTIQIVSFLLKDISKFFKVNSFKVGQCLFSIPDLIYAGAAAIYPIQAPAANMETEKLKQDFVEKVSFCGGVDAQQLMVNGTPGQVKDKIAQLKQIFPTGLIISPSHEAILPDTNPANIEALFNAI